MINDILLSANVLGGNGTYDKAWAKNEKYFPLYMYPKGSIGGFGDQGGQPQGVWMKQVYNILGYITKDPAVKWASDQLGEIPGDIYLNNYYWGAALNQMEGKPPLDLPLSKYFKDIGWVAMHSDLVDPNRVSMFFKSSPYGSYNHSHPDQNSFIIQAYGEPLAIESGYMDAYYSTFEMGYTRQTFAHNAITLDDGKGQPIGKITAKGEIDDFINHCDFNVTSGDAVAAYDGLLDKAKRYVIYIKPETFIVVDDLKGKNGKKSNFEFWLNAQENVSLYENHKGGRIVQGDAALDAKVQYPEKIEGFYSNLFSGPDLIGFKPKFDFETAPIQKRVWFQTEKLAQTKMVTTLDVHKEDEAAQYIKSETFDNYIKMQFEDGTYVYVNTSDKDEITVENMKFNGVALVVNENSIMLVDGKSLSVDEKLVMQSDVPVSIAKGKDELSISSITKDANVSVSIPNTTAMRDEKGRAIESADSGVGITWNQNGENGEFKMYPGSYNLILNNKFEAGKILSTKPANVKINGKDTSVNMEYYKDHDGKLCARGELPLENGFYYIDDATKGLSIRNCSLGDVLVANSKEEISVKDLESLDVEIKLELNSLATGKMKVSTERNSNAAKSKCDVVVEAENFKKKLGNGVAYNTRSFLSGGAGITEFNVSGDYMSWNMDVPEDGEYDIVIRYVSWDGTNIRPAGTTLAEKPLKKDYKLIRFFKLGDEKDEFVAPMTGSYGSTEEEWAALRVHSKAQLKKGENELKIWAKSGLWNIDWIGLVKSDK
ncbi:MAG: heparinase II/III family protein [Oscillospiraceae bacterium]